jgi:hypothetical protein
LFAELALSGGVADRCADRAFGGAGPKGESSTLGQQAEQLSVDLVDPVASVAQGA